MISRIWSKLIFASCMWYLHYTELRAGYGVYDVVEDMAGQFPWMVHT